MAVSRCVVWVKVGRDRSTLATGRHLNVTHIAELERENTVLPQWKPGVAPGR